MEANLELGFQPDMRDYGIGNQILAELGLTTIRILTNNPKKITGIEGFGLEVVEQVPIETTPNAQNARYLATNVTSSATSFIKDLNTRPWRANERELAGSTGELGRTGRGRGSRRGAREEPLPEEAEEEVEPQLRAPGEQQHAYGELNMPDDVNARASLMERGAALRSSPRASTARS